MIPKAVLIDKRNIAGYIPIIISKIKEVNFVGIDIETEDSRRHEGLNRLMKMDDEGFKSSTAKLIFDVERTTVTGVSLYADGDDEAYYFNLAHADKENCIPFEWLKVILDSKPAESWWVSHNSPFELTMMFKSLGYDLGEKILCTMQLAVTCWNDDTYDHNDLSGPDLGEIPSLFNEANRHFASWQYGQELSKEQEELIGKVTAKESKAAHSYLGFIKTITYGYGLKKLVKRFLNYEQVTFEEVLNGRPHMGCLTGEEVVSYGADDAWTCVKLFHILLAYLMANNPQAVSTYFNQENPMTRLYSKVWREGVMIDKQKVLEAREFERGNIAKTLKKMKAAVKAMLPFPEDVHDKLIKYDIKAYGKEGTAEKYRAQVTKWANSADSEDPFTQIFQVRGSISKSLAEERGIKESLGVNLTYYQVVRCILYDLCRCSFQLSHGKIQSDGEARSVMRERWLKKYEDIIETDAKAQAVLTILDCYVEMASSEQVTKLYITNYLNMIDPDTGKMYPLLSSALATRRMALQQPNLSQLAKNSVLAYVRAFFLPDEEDHVILSADWSSIELVIIGELSGDPEFAKCFAQIPYEDLHGIAAASALNISLEEFNARPDKKALRTDIGKGSNFNYWYSGALGTVANKMGWSSEEMWERVEGYRNRFAVAEQWRVDTINDGKINGYVELPDGQRRYKFEATQEWAGIMRSKFEQYGPAIAKFGDLIIKKIITRAGNQLVNAKVQGTGATLIKRSALKLDKEIPAQGLRARFMFPVHDEFVFSVHKDDVIKFIPVLRGIMCNHPEIFKKLRVNCSIAIGKNYGAFDLKKNPKGQIELDELQKGVPGFDESRYNQKLNDDEIQKVLDYLHD